MMCAIASAAFLISFINLVTTQCPQNCQSCSDTYQCLSCKVGYWGVYCANTCSNNCTDSNCDNNGYCYACVNGMYGPNCKEDCQLCKNGECGPRECTSGCRDGYYKYISGDHSYCYHCQDNCQKCKNSTYCTFCGSGYYIYKYTIPIEPKRAVAACTACQLNNICDQCSKLSNCSQCSLSEGKVSCEHCIEGYTLDNNQCVKNIPCSQYSLNGCSSIGICDGCRDGKTGNECNYHCRGMCAKCSQYNQNLCQLCNDGFFTSTCDISCPQNCASSKCDFNNGTCLNGCLPGFWGNICEYMCSDHCAQWKCNRDGTCSHGCTAGYDGLYCNVTTTTTMTMVLTSSSTSGLVTPNTSSDSSRGVSTVCHCQEDRCSFGPVVGGAVTGAVLITALLVGSIAYFLHRRSVSRTNNKEQRTDTMYYNIVGRSSVYEETGQNINKASEMRTNQTPEISVYDQLSGTKTDHVYSGL